MIAPKYKLATINRLKKQDRTWYSDDDRIWAEALSHGVISGQPCGGTPLLHSRNKATRDWVEDEAGKQGAPTCDHGNPMDIFFSISRDTPFAPALGCPLRPPVFGQRQIRLGLCHLGFPLDLSLCLKLGGSDVSPKY
ncbi:hypothetical protein PM082_020702 [Marasmius tenuissimus]|nr:hypothetical protein PM082_020702 [Marasmius tenuissimus]